MVEMRRSVPGAAHGASLLAMNGNESPSTVDFELFSKNTESQLQSWLESKDPWQVARTLALRRHDGLAGIGDPSGLDPQLADMELGVGASAVRANQAAWEEYAKEAHLDPHVPRWPCVEDVRGPWRRCCSSSDASWNHMVDWWAHVRVYESTPIRSEKDQEEASARQRSADTLRASLRLG